MIVESMPARRDNEWSVLSVDQLGAHVYEPESLLYFWLNRVIILGELAKASHMFQVLDVSCFAPLEGQLKDINAFYISQFGANQMNQFEYPRL